ncbi:unnamed protein product [Didymodactylos carnosus]|uniref:G-protein coupled receptors family 1 profile domain-containing protein n=1 Tax=Didymodactylos carnosus TaxID=1234261 RepID=A0A814EU37_9BILA|nr:unnamed protein product [Didymodactylos carnosus]CAF1385879.1 unnamed protein product [Didymodactylos carnosus]CAF3743859.1 unnamed protein product [Didymodactylos carnosus]CAF4193904.1 unnamed protein product [Didymodactylos carnosus]
MNRRMCRYPVSIFMVSLSLVNIIILGGPVMMQWLNHRLLIGFVVTGSRFVCGLHVYIDIVGSSINSWLILFIAIERYLSIAKPLLIRKRFKREHAYIIIFIIVFLAALVPISLLMIGYHIPKCLLVYSRTYQIIGSIEICIVYVIPSMLIFMLSLISIRKLRYRLKNNLGRRIHISVLLIIVSLSFTALTLPFQIHWYISIVQSFIPTNFRLNLFNISFRYLTLTIRNMNYTFNFFLYSIVFLKDTFVILHCEHFQSKLTFIGRKKKDNRGDHHGVTVSLRDIRTNDFYALCSGKDANDSNNTHCAHYYQWNSGSGHTKQMKKNCRLQVIKN